MRSWRVPHTAVTFPSPCHRSGAQQRSIAEHISRVGLLLDASTTAASLQQAQPQSPAAVPTSEATPSAPVAATPAAPPISLPGPTTAAAAAPSTSPVPTPPTLIPSPAVSIPFTETSAAPPHPSPEPAIAGTELPTGDEPPNGAAHMAAGSSDGEEGAEVEDAEEGEEEEEAGEEESEEVVGDEAVAAVTAVAATSDEVTGLEVDAEVAALVAETLAVHGAPGADDGEGSAEACTDRKPLSGVSKAREEGVCSFVIRGYLPQDFCRISSEGIGQAIKRTRGCR